MLPRILAAVVLALLALPAVATAAPRVQHLKYRYGPITITPGQNTISLDDEDVPRPRVPGYIIGFRPNLKLVNGRIPGVDVLHLHHAVWLINGAPTFAAGEEKTNVKLPRPFGWRHRPRDSWVLNHMVHNLLPNRARVYLTYAIDFVPDSSPLAKRMRSVETTWVDVEGGRAYPVFDVHRGAGANGRFTYPRDAPDAYGGGPARNRQVVQRDGVLVQTAGHLHPGGLWTDLLLTRGGRTVNLFRSRAKYWEPAGAVSWDVAMTATRANWRVKVKRGDVLSVQATYDSRRASWYESMGIMPVAFAPGARGGVDPFSGRLERRGRLTHGHLRENNNHGGDAGGLPDARTLPDGPAATADPLAITDFLYGQGDLLRGGAASRPPVVAPGAVARLPQRRRRAHDLPHDHRLPGALQPLDGDRLPARRRAGRLRLRRARLRARGLHPRGQPRHAGRRPTNLGPGTYTYFCRVHPFMRGAFRVKD